MKLSIIIPTNKNSRRLEELLHSLEKQDFLSEEYETIIVFNGRSVKNVSFKNTTKIKILQSPKGANKARNKGLANAKGDFVLFLDDDTYLQDQFYLTTILKCANEHPQYAAIGGTYKLAGQKGYFDRSYADIAQSWQASDPLHNLVGGNSLYHFKKLKHYLKFNENISFGATEIELNLRLSQMGFNLKVFHELSVQHKTKISLFDFLKKAFFQGMGHHFIERASLGHKLDSESSLSTNITNKLYQYCYRIGYRYGLKSLHQSIKPHLILFAVACEFFQIESDQILKPRNNQNTSYHLTKYPAFRFKQLYHWIKGNSWKARWHFFEVIKSRVIWFLKMRVLWFLRWRVIWFLEWRVLPFLTWRIPWFLKWRVLWFFKWRFLPLLVMFPLAAAWMLFPFNMVALSVPYEQVFRKFKL